MQVNRKGDESREIYGLCLRKAKSTASLRKKYNGLGKTNDKK